MRWFAGGGKIRGLAEYPLMSVCALPLTHI